MPTAIARSKPIGPEELTAPFMGHALRQGLNIPVCALRASMEALRQEIPWHDEGHILLRGAIEEVDRIGQNVRDLMEFAARPTPRPLQTTAHEVLSSALSALGEENRARVRSLDATSGARLELDAPLVAGALRRILANALEATSGDVLVTARRTSQGANALSLGIVNGRVQAFEPRWALEPFRTSKPNHLGLGLTLANRDVRLHGGTLSQERLRSGGMRVVLQVPLTGQARGSITATRQRRGL